MNNDYLKQKLSTFDENTTLKDLQKYVNVKRGVPFFGTTRDFFHLFHFFTAPFALCP